MTSFLEKLKKGMNIKETPDINNSSAEEDQSPAPVGPASPPTRFASEARRERGERGSLSEAERQETTTTEKPETEQPIKDPTLAFAPVKGVTARESSENRKTKKSKRKKIEKSKKEKKEEKEEKKEEEKFKIKKIEIKKEPATTEARKNKKEKRWFEPEGELVIDVYQTDEEIIIQSAIAGVKPEDLDISIENDMVTIKGNRKKLFEKSQTNYFYQECYWGSFSREIILPTEVDGKRARATMENGILTIRIPKIEREKKKKIVVKG